MHSRLLKSSYSITLVTSNDERRYIIKENCFNTLEFVGLLIII